MDKFVEEAFKQVDNAIVEKAASAFDKVIKENRFAITFSSCVSVGVTDMARLIRAVKGAGLESVLREYENYLLAGGFKYGFQAGRESMLEDHV